MAAASGRPTTTVDGERTVENRLYEDGAAFHFFQAVRLLERLAPVRRAVGRNAPPSAEVVRFRALPSLSFPANKGVYEIMRPLASSSLPTMVVSFMGLTGPKGALPDHYTELLIRLGRERKDAERTALRDWLDLFNHRFLSLFYRAWEKYRFHIPYERGDYALTEPDDFTRALLSFIGMEMPALRNRLRVSCREEIDGEPSERVLAGIDDLALLHYGGLLAQQTRCTVSLQAMLEDYFSLPIAIEQFYGGWLSLDAASQSRMGVTGGNNLLGRNIVAGERVWEVQGKFRVRLGPLRYREFVQFLPDRQPVSERKAFFLLVHLVRLYVGPAIDFDVQLVLKAEDVPPCQLAEKAGLGPRLGWNTWICSQPRKHDAEDAAFAGEEVVWMGN
jgi:type VI secretion system protein ImpH